MRRRVALFLAGGVVLALAAASVAAPPTETRYVGQLRSAVAQGGSSVDELAGLKAGDPELTVAGSRLAAASASGCRALRAYQHATTRFGTDEEYRLVQQLQAQLRQARVRYGSLVAVTLASPASARLSTAQQLLRTYAAGAARKQVARWVGDERLADILTSGDLKRVRAGLEQELARRIDAAARSLSQRATGLALSLGAPLGAQVESQAEQAALTWLSRTALQWDATGLVIRIVGVPVVRFLRAELKQVFRDHKHVTARTDRTVKGFDARMAELQKLIDTADTAKLATVRRLLSRAQRAIDATVYLKGDLRKQGRAELTARLDRAEAALVERMKETRQVFLLDSALARSNLARAADDLCKLQGEVAQITKKLTARASFAITAVHMPNPTVNGPQLDLKVSWRGKPTFPVKIVLFPNTCPAGINCTTPTYLFTERANPLVFVGAAWCTGGGGWRMDYSVYLEDADGVRTPAAPAPSTCLAG